MTLVLNFKTYLKKTSDYLNLIKKIEKIKGNFWLAINPYFYLQIYPLINKKKFKIGLQNLGPITEKPQTGETIYDFELIKKADFILIGHSERYRLGENLELIKEKVKILQEKNLKLLIFFSENSYKPKKSFTQVKKQTEKNLKNILSVIKKENYSKIYFVYEPWWAISTEGGKIPERKFLEEFLNWYFKFIDKYNYRFPIFYGGSYNSVIALNYQDLKFDGYVLGKAAVNFQEIKTIVSRNKKIN